MEMIGSLFVIRNISILNIYDPIMYENVIIFVCIFCEKVIVVLKNLKCTKCSYIHIDTSKHI